jgi:hypothetical protein
MKLKGHIEYGSFLPLPMSLYRGTHIWTRRKKLEPEQVKVLSVKVNKEVSRDIEEPDFDAQSILQVEIPPWAESYEFTVTGVEGVGYLFHVHTASDKVHRRPRVG